jgi:phosphoribosylformylglycinamidine cyclo-ligase
VFDLIGRLGAVPQADLERTLNLGVGMVAVLEQAAADSAMELLDARGVPAWVAGEVTDADPAPAASDEVVQGAKGVDGGAARLVGVHGRPA